ncbi:MAG: T9SS type A sorting domain-containing protein [Saprospiraceae bacterium]|nr:T9SS type A sorting domain-containing protein [Saprospiraceae bacterium]
MFLKASNGGMLSIFTVEGKFVHQTSFTAGANRHSPNLSPGLYFFRCRLENGKVVTHRVAVQH